MKKLHKICITPLVVVCSLHVPKSLNFTYAFKYYQQKCKWLHFSWATLYTFTNLTLWLVTGRACSLQTNLAPAMQFILEYLQKTDRLN